MVAKILVDVQEAMEILSIGRTKLLELTYDGEIPSIKVGRRRLYKTASLEEWAQAQQEEDALGLPH